MPNPESLELIEAAKAYMCAVTERLNAQHAFRSEGSEENSRLYGLSIDGLRFTEQQLRAAIAKAEGK